MSRPIVVEARSRLTASPSEVWTRIATMAGVNDELWPLVQMTYPADRSSLDRVEVQPGEVLFRSWLLLWGLLPFDRHRLALVRLDPGRGFLEVSRSWLQRRWQHARTVEGDEGGGCIVTDRLEVEPRLGFARPLTAMVVQAIFRHRHRRLRRRFGEAVAAEARTGGP